MTTDKYLTAAILIAATLVAPGIASIASASNDADSHANHEEHDAENRQARTESHNGGADDSHGDEDAIELSDAQVQLAKLETATAAGGTLRETIQVYGRIEPVPARTAVVHARYAGRIVQLGAEVGQAVKRGEVLATVEADDSLQHYELPAPISGIIIERMASAGEATAGRNLLRIADYSEVWAQLAVFPAQAGRVTAGQSVWLHGEELQADGVIDWVAPVADHGPARRARVVLPNPDDRWAPGSTIRAEIVSAVSDAPLVVDNRALQEIEGKPSVFVRSGGRFEVHPVVLGRSDGRVTEVLGGLEPGAVYVTVNSYLLKAELEKSGAEHGH